MVHLFGPGTPGYRWNIGSLLIVVAWLATIALMLTGRNDLDIYLQAAHDLLNGQDPYTQRYFEHYNFFYSPVFALLVAPLGMLGGLGAKAVWGLATLAAALRSLQLLLRWAGLQQLPPVRQAAITFFAGLFLFQAVRDNINLSQVTVLLVWACVEGLHRMEQGPIWPGALLVALALDTKLIPLVLLPYLAYRGQWRALVAVVIGVAVLQIIPLLVFGTEEGLALFRSRWALLDPASPRHILDEEEPSMISWGSLLSAYLSTEGGNVNTLDLPRNLAQLSLQSITVLVWTGRLLLALIALYFLGWPPFRAAATPLHRFRELGYLLACTILLFPHQRPYSLFLAAPAVVWLCRYGVLMSADKGHRSTITLAALFVIYLGMNANLLAGEWAHYYDHYKLLSFVLVLLLVLLARFTPERMVALDHHMD
jgi:hypothetical protein